MDREAVFSFGLVLFGLALMGDATAPLKDNHAVRSLFEANKESSLGLSLWGHCLPLWFMPRPYP